MTNMQFLTYIFCKIINRFLGTNALSYLCVCSTHTTEKINWLFQWYKPRIKKFVH